MRNPNRRRRVLKLLDLIWSKQNDTRFNQLIYNLQYEYANKKNSYKNELWRKDEYKGIVAYQKEFVVDLFNVEDEAFIEFLEEKVRELWA